jgi:putative phage-type endonuclease
MKHLTQYDTREAWLKARTQCVSSTESAALFGMSQFGTAFELAQQKLNGAADVESNERIAWGARLQAAIAQGIADDYGVIIESLDLAYAVHPEHPRMGSSFDFTIVDAKEPFSDLGKLVREHGPGLLEIKNVDWLVYKNWPEHDAPDHIEIQVQHELEVAQLPWAVLGVLVGGNRTELYTRMRDVDVGAAIARKVDEFWQNLEKGILPPVVMPQDADIVIRLYGYAEPNKVFDGQNDEVLWALCQHYEEASLRIKAATDAQKTAKAEILQHIGDAERALVKGYTLSAAMVAPAEVQAYTRGGYRNFRLTKKKTDG